MPLNRSAKTPRTIFLDAVEQHPPDDWPAFLDAACGDDGELRGQVERLLDAHGRVSDFMARPAAGPPPTIDFPAGEQVGGEIGPYKLLEQIGEGGMGVVYMAHQARPVKRKVALKLIKPGLDSRQVVARFEAERQALSLMDHPSIARVLDAGATDTGRPYFVMELVRGIPITDYCDQARLTPRKRLELFITVCRAVQHAHQKGIIHRDLKPSNVLVTLHDGVPVAKVIDFGVAKALHQELTERTLFTLFSQMIGTPLYMSPEQAEMSCLDVDTRSDVYSLGVLLYELLTGQTPFDAETLKNAGFDEMRRMIREDEPPRPSARLSTLGAPAISTLAHERGLDERRLRQTLRGESDWIVMKSLEKDRTRRYESASALAADVQRYLDDQPIQARPASWLLKARKWRRRNPVAAITIGAGLLLLTSLVAAELWHARRLSDSLAVSDRLRKEGLAREANLLEEQYVGDMRMAWHAIGTGNGMETQRLLQRHAPQTGTPSYAGFEWHYLHSRTKLQMPQLTMTGHRGELLSIDVSPDERLIASSDRAGEVRIRQLDSGELIKLLAYSDQEVTTVRFSPSGKLLATAGMDKIVHLWNVESWDEVAALQRHEMTICGVAWSPDGKWLASAGRDSAVHVWDVQSHLLVQTLSHSDVVRAVAWSPDGSVLATAAGDQGLRLWDADTWKDRGQLGSQPGRFLCIAFSPNSQLVAAGGYGAVVRLFDVQRHSEVASAGSPRLWSLVFLDDSQLIVGSEGGWQPWSFDRSNAALTALDNPRGGPGKIRGIVPINGGHLLVVACEEYRTIVVQDTSFFTARQEPVFEWPEGVMPKQRLIFNADLVAERLHIQRLGDGSQAAEMKYFPHINPVASPAEDRVAVAETGADIRIWNTATWQPVQLVRSPEKRRVREIHFSADSQRLAAGCFEGVAGVWNLQSGEWQEILQTGSQQYCLVKFSPSRNLLACAVRDSNVVELWDLDHTKRLNRLVLDSGANSLCFSPDGCLLAVGESGMTISLWDVAGVKVDTLTGHGHVVTTLAFSPDGRTLASGSADTTVRLWSVAARRELFVLCRASRFNWFNFVDGSLFMAQGPHNKLWVFPGADSTASRH